MSHPPREVLREGSWPHDIWSVVQLRRGFRLVGAKADRVVAVMKVWDTKDRND